MARQTSMRNGHDWLEGGGSAATEVHTEVVHFQFPGV